MNLSVRGFLTVIRFGLVPVVLLAWGARDLQAARPLVPGTGEKLTAVGDDFEDENWEYIYNGPKSSENLDRKHREPTGYSKNGMWLESLKRGQPDIIRRIPTPEGGLPGSKGSLLLRSKNTGIPGSPSWKPQQDDLIVNCVNKLGGFTPISWNPSVVVRVYLPPFKYWEKHSSTSFALRAEVAGWERGKMEAYWPGIFIEFRSKSEYDKDSAAIFIRANDSGQDGPSYEVKQLGWWTLGMSFTADGFVHYYASPGVDDLTERDRIASEIPYGIRPVRFKTFFFNVANFDNGRNWSTPWIIDDPSMYFIRPRLARRNR